MYYIGFSFVIDFYKLFRMNLRPISRNLSSTVYRLGISNLKSLKREILFFFKIEENALGKVVQN